MKEKIPIERVEKQILDQVKFIDIVLKEIKEREALLLPILGTNYGKLIGIIAPFKTATKSLKQVRTEFGTYLELTRNVMSDEYKERFNSEKKLTLGWKDRGNTIT